LREEVYEELMKPYFAAGQNHKDFLKVWFNQENTNVQRLRDKKDGKKKKNFYQSYIMIDPYTSRIYAIWELVFLLAAIFEITVVPYVCCTQIENYKSSMFTYQLVADVIWLFHILISSVTAYRVDLELVNTPWPILKRYIK
jgi:hypothetical protein